MTEVTYQPDEGNQVAHSSGSKWYRGLTLRWLLPLLIVYIVGGSVQYFGILSVTQSNVIVIILFLQTLLFRSGVNQLRYEAPIFIFIAYVILWRLVCGSTTVNMLIYIYYLLVTVVAAASGRFYAAKFLRLEALKNFFKLFVLFLILQLFITLLQASFTQTFISSARVPIGFVDAIFGTFFLQSDAGLAAVCELVLIVAYTLPLRKNIRIILTALSMSVVFMTNSKTAQMVIIFIIGVLILRYLLSIRGGVDKKNVLRLISFYAIIVAFVGACFIFSKNIFDFLLNVELEYYKRGDWHSAARFAPLGQIYIKGLDWFGEGPLTYYNPITKVWLYNSGFSTLYEIYIDYGLVGVLLYFGYQLYLIFKFTSDILVRIAFLAVLSSFTLFNFGLTDIGFIFFFNFSLMAIKRFETTPLSRKESRPQGFGQGYRWMTASI